MYTSYSLTLIEVSTVYYTKLAEEIVSLMLIDILSTNIII